MYIYTSRAGQAGGGSFKEKNYKPKKEFAYRMCTGWPTTAMPKPSFLSERAFSRSMVVMWWPVLMWLVAGWDPKFCGWLWDDARWGNVVSCEMSCHVMWCDLMCLHLMWCDFLCCVMSRDALRCHVMSSHSCDELSSVVKWCGAMGWDLMSLWCDVAGCDVTLCGSKWLRGVNWKMIWWSVLHRSTPVLFCTTQHYSSTTLYYTVLLQYYSVLHSTTPVLLCTTKYYSCTTKHYSSTILYYKVLLQYYNVLLQYYKVLLQYYSVLQSTTPVLLRTTKYYSSTTKYYSSTILYYKVLLQYSSVLHSTTPVLFCTTQYYSSTTLYYKVLLQYYKVLLQYYKVLLQYFCTTKYYSSTAKYYSSTTLYYKVLLQYYSVLQSTTPELFCTTKYYSSTIPVLLCTTKYYSLYYKVLICKARSTNITNVTKCCACHAKWPSWLILATYETSFTMRRATGLILQRHQILHLPRKMTFMIDVRHIWNVIYNAVSNRTHLRTSPNTAPAHLQCAEQQDSPSNVTKYCACHAKLYAENSWSVSYNGGRFHGRSDHDPTMKLQNWTRPFAELTFPSSATDFVLKITTFRAPAIYPDFTKYPNTAPATKSDTPTSPKAVPATQYDSHEWCPSHMKRHLQCAEQQDSSSNVTKYCTCHAKWLSWLMSVTYMKRHLQCAEQQNSSLNVTKYCACHVKWLSWLMSITYETSFTMRGATGITLQPHQILRLQRKIAFQNRSQIVRRQMNCHLQCATDANVIRPWSDHDPSMIRPWTRHLAPARSPSLLFALRRRVLYWKLQHFALWLSTQISPNTAPATKSDIPTSPNAVPATKSHNTMCDTHDMERQLQCAEQQDSPSKLTKYCACHVNWHAWLMPVTYEMSFTMRGATGITLQPHQILRLPWRITLMIDPAHIWKVIYNARSNRHHLPTSPNTAPAPQNSTPKSKKKLPKTIEASFTMADDSRMIRKWS